MLINILGFTLATLLICCQSANNGYHELEKILKKIEKNEETNLTALLETAIAKTGVSPLHLQKIAVPLSSEDDLSRFIQNPVLLDFKKAFTLHSNFNAAAAREVRKSMEEKYDLEGEFPFLQFYLKTTLCKKITPEILGFVKRQEVNKLSQIDLYHYVQALKNLGSNYIIGLDLEFRLAFLQYALHLIDSQPRAKSFLKTKGQILLNKGLQYSSGSEDYESAALDAFQEAQFIFQAIGDKDYYELAKWHSTMYAENRFESSKITKLKSLDLPKGERLILLTDVAIEIMEKHPKLAMDYFNEGLKIIGDNTCTLYYNYLLNFKGELFFNQNATAQALHNFQLAAAPQDCSMADNLLFQYLNLRIQKPFINFIKEDTTKTVLLNDLKIEKELAEMVLREDPDHLDDLLAEYTIRKTKLFFDQPVTTKQLQQEMLSVFHQSKNRRLKKIKKEDEIKSASKANLKKQQFLRSLSDLKTNVGFKNPKYSELLSILIDEHSSPTLQSGTIEHLNTTAVMQAVDSNNYQILNFLQYENNYVGYLYNQNKMQLFELDTATLFRAHYEYETQLKKRENILPAIQQFKQLCSNTLQIDPTIPLLISTDGVLSNLPWHLIFDHVVECARVPNLNTFFKNQLRSIDKKSCLLFSYSDSKTASDRKTVREWPELPATYQECISLMQKFELSSEQLHAGYSCNPEFLQAARGIDLLHCALHASSNKFNRLDNYLVFRSKKGQALKLYSHDIENLGIAPKVVFLSACETGLGLERSGTGAFSISNAFVKNGTQTIVKTLWKINDKAAAEFISSVYKQWLTGLTLAEALALARERARQASVDTLDWAGFVLEGNGNVRLQ